MEQHFGYSELGNARNYLQHSWSQHVTGFVDTLPNYPCLQNTVHSFSHPFLYWSQPCLHMGHRLGMTGSLLVTSLRPKQLTVPSCLNEATTSLSCPPLPTGQNLQTKNDDNVCLSVIYSARFFIPGPVVTFLTLHAHHTPWRMSHITQVLHLLHSIELFFTETPCRLI